MKAFTDIEQSKKLMELGIDVHTADMYWLNRHIDLTETKYESFVVDRYNKHIDFFNSYAVAVDNNEIVPSWSLSALLDLLPQSVEDEEYRRYDQHIHRDLDNTYWIEYKKGFYQSPLYDTYCSEELVDVCVEMLETLTKNGKLCLDDSFATTK